MLKFLLPLLLISANAQAQAFDLRTMPEDYSFVSLAPDARVTLRFIGRNGDLYLFDELIEQHDGTTKTAQIRVNQASQTTYWSLNGNWRAFFPHDCGPSLGECTYTWSDEDGSVNMRSITKLVGDIWLSDTYYENGSEWVFWSRDCTVYDEFGFWIDFVRLDSDDETSFGARERAGETRLDELWQVCDPPDFIS